LHNTGIISIRHSALIRNPFIGQMSILSLRLPRRPLPLHTPTRASPPTPILDYVPGRVGRSPHFSGACPLFLMGKGWGWAIGASEGGWRSGGAETGANPQKWGKVSPPPRPTPDLARHGKLAVRRLLTKLAKRWGWHFLTGRLEVGGRQKWGWGWGVRKKVGLGELSNPIPGLR
jgi:hypothetical protein